MEVQSKMLGTQRTGHCRFSLALDAAPVVPARRGSYRRTATKSINQDAQVHGSVCNGFGAGAFGGEIGRFSNCVW